MSTPCVKEKVRKYKILIILLSSLLQLTVFRVVTVRSPVFVTTPLYAVNNLYSWMCVTVIIYSHACARAHDIISYTADLGYNVVVGTLTRYNVVAMVPPKRFTTECISTFIITLFNLGVKLLCQVSASVCIFPFGY